MSETLDKTEALKRIAGNNCITCSADAFNALLTEKRLPDSSGVDHATDNLLDNAVEGLLMPPTDDRQVIVGGRAIPNLFARRTDAGVCFVLDGRFAAEVPNEYARPVAFLLAQCLAIGAGYSSAASETKDRPFAPLVAEWGHKIP